jgi:hypothetical protein
MNGFLGLSGVRLREHWVSDAFRNESAYGLWPTTSGAAGFEMLTTVTVPAKYARV